MSKPTFTVTSDRTEDVAKILRGFKNDAVLVGVPREENSRSDGPIGNASLLSIMVFGSPMNNIPPWNIMGIGLTNAQPEIIDQFRQGAKKALEVGLPALDQTYERVGIISSNSIKKVLNSQQGAPEGRPTKATLANRKRIGFKGTKYWIVTGQLRNSITYVVNKGGF